MFQQSHMLNILTYLWLVFFMFYCLMNLINRKKALYSHLIIFHQPYKYLYRCFRKIDTLESSTIRWHKVVLLGGTIIGYNYMSVIGYNYMSV